MASRTPRPKASDRFRARPISGLGDGGGPARARAAALDSFLGRLARAHLEDAPPVALVAVGGYGRGELAPWSDIDLLLLSHQEVPPVGHLLYPLWDAGLQVGHAVLSPKEAIERGEDDLHAATALFSARFIEGDRALFEELLDRRARWLAVDRRRVVKRILNDVADRHERGERAGWSLAPDIKKDIGGLRDAHTLRWLGFLARTSPPGDLHDPYETLMAVRHAVHEVVDRKTDRVRMDLQALVAARLGFDGDDGRDRMMARVHSAARTIEHVGGGHRRELASALAKGPRRSGSILRYSTDVSSSDGALSSTRADCLEGALEVMAAVAATGKPLAADTATAVETTFATHPVVEVWSDELRECFVRLLRGRYSATALEMLDHTRGWDVLVPEWCRIRGLAQHDPYHRYTVDGHCFAAVQGIFEVVERDPLAKNALAEAGDADALYVATLLHDIGKGSGEDHSVVGAAAAQRISHRMGFLPEEVQAIATLVRHHLLLSDTAARRDISDPQVVAGVCSKLGDGRIARLAYVLSVADGLATGPESWSTWKASLVRTLYLRALSAIETGIVRPTSSTRMRAADISRHAPGLAHATEEVLAGMPPAYLDSAPPPALAQEVALLQEPLESDGIRAVVRPGDHPELVLVVPDRPGALACTSGVMALHGLDVLGAQVFSSTAGVALQRFTLAPHPNGWADTLADVAAAFAGDLPVDARVEAKISDYRPTRPPRCHVLVLEQESTHSTVVEVRTSNALGLLYVLTSALAHLDLDIHVAKIDTLGRRVVDVFYVRDRRGHKPSPAQAVAVEDAIGERVNALFGS